MRISTNFLLLVAALPITITQAVKRDPIKVSDKPCLDIVSFTGWKNLKTTSTKIPNTLVERSLAAGAFIDDKLMYCGGQDVYRISNNGSDPSLLIRMKYSSSDCFELGQTGAWNPGPTMNEERYKFTINKVGQKLVAMGGYGTGRKSTEILEDGKWRKGKDLSTVRANHCAVTISDSELIIVGGNSERYGALDLVEKFDIRDDGETVPLPNLPKASSGVSCSLLDSQHIIVAGGWPTKKDVRILNFSYESQWYQIPELPKNIYFGFLFMNCGEIQVYGGAFTSDVVFTYTPESDDYKQGKWTESKTSLKNSGGIKVAVPTTFRENQQLGGGGGF